MINNRDLIAGLALILAGAAYAAYAAWTLPLGTVRQMGAGMFPAAIGLLLAILGACIALPALVRAEPLPTLKPRALVTVLASIVAFGVLVRSTGFIPAIVVTTILASFALPGRRPLVVLTLCAVLALLCWLIFIVLLDLTVPLFRLRVAWIS